MFDLNSLLTEKKKYMQDSELGSQVPLISSDGPRHGILPLEYGMRGQRLSASTWNSGSAYYSLWFYWSRFLLYFPFLSSYLNPKFWKYRESVLFNPFFSLSLCKIEKKKRIWFSISYFLFFYSVNLEFIQDDYSKGWKSGKKVDWERGMTVLVEILNIII